jgi:cytochrome c peroxidase
MLAVIAERSARQRGIHEFPAFRYVLGRVAVSCLTLVFVLTAMGAEVPEAPRYNLTGLTEHEPITPVPAPPAAEPLKLALGEHLFADPRLSADGSRACISCHDIHTNGATTSRLDKAIDGSELPLNTPTIFNAALSFRLNWEGNLRTLEAQAESVLKNQQTMARSIDDALRKMQADPRMRQQFEEAYGHAPDRASLLDAIVTYERSLVTPGGRFDRWLGGDAAALSAVEQDGYRLFKSLGCISCHQGVNVGGNLFERQGIFHPLASPPPEIVRVPSLRNVATTPPYFHDGSASTLDEAVRRMGDAQLDQILSDQQIKAIVAFLDTLTGTYRGAPVVAASP